ncbi:MAG: helix-turn-helix domain-containing protein, partial [Kiritimatiellae bacterium]|nr:helix-turn-helix domain-containing protein [Kiritimatiellia bacterium]
MSLGEELRSARVARGLTPSQVALATKMKVQTVEALENEDFDRIAAPIYAKGFIRLYAQCVGLDPAPLIEEYTRRFVPQSATVSALRAPRKTGRALAGDTDAVTSSGQTSGEDLFAIRVEEEARADGEKTAPVLDTKPGWFRWAHVWEVCRSLGTAIRPRIAELLGRSGAFLKRWCELRGCHLSKGKVWSEEMRAILPKALPLALGIL